MSSRFNFKDISAKYNLFIYLFMSSENYVTFNLFKMRFQEFTLKFNCLLNNTKFLKTPLFSIKIIFNQDCRKRKHTSTKHTHMQMRSNKKLRHFFVGLTNKRKKYCLDFGTSISCDCIRKLSTDTSTVNILSHSLNKTSPDTFNLYTKLKYLIWIYSVIDLSRLNSSSHEIIH